MGSSSIVLSYLGAFKGKRVEAVELFALPFENLGSDEENPILGTLVSVSLMLLSCLRILPAEDATFVVLV